MVSKVVLSAIFVTLTFSAAFAFDSSVGNQVTTILPDHHGVADNSKAEGKIVTQTREDVVKSQAIAQTVNTYAKAPRR